MNPSLKKQIVRTFIQTIADLKNTKEIETFLKDFLTEEELETQTKRLAIAYWLKKGRSEENIKQNLKASQKEIKEVEKILNSPGIKLAIKKMEAEEWANVWSEKIKRFTK